MSIFLCWTEIMITSSIISTFFPPSVIMHKMKHLWFVCSFLFGSMTALDKCRERRKCWDLRLMVIFSTSGFIGKLSFAWIENWFIFFSSEEFSLVSWKPKGCVCSSVFFLFPWPVLFFFHFPANCWKATEVSPKCWKYAGHSNFFLFFF